MMGSGYSGGSVAVWPARIGESPVVGKEMSLYYKMERHRRDLGESSKEIYEEGRRE